MSASIDKRTGTPLGRVNDRGSVLDPHKPNTSKRESTRPNTGRKS